MVEVMLKLCRQCGKEFEAPLHNIKMGFGIYCSRKCRGLAQSGKNNPLWRGGEVKRICSHCGKEFSVHPGAVKQGRGINCSIKCQGLERKRKGMELIGSKNPMFGKHHSSETKQKIKEGRKNKYGKENHPLWGKHHSIETKKKMSEIKMGKYKGEDNPHWLGGISYEPYSALFNRQLKDRVRVRDNFICQLCGVPELECNQRLSIHHINYDKKDCNMDNLVSLCRPCNSKVNGDRGYWECYFNEIIKEN